MRGRWMICLVALVAAACGGGSPAGTTSTTATTLAQAPTIEGAVVLGEKIFLLETDFNMEGLLLEEGMLCTGQDGYVDVEEGARLIVKNEDGTVIGTGSLRSGAYVLNPAALTESGADDALVVPDYGTHWDRRDSFVDTRGDCAFPFTIPLSTEAGFYSVSMGNRGELVFSHAEMEGQGWSVSLQLGDRVNPSG